MPVWGEGFLLWLSGNVHCCIACVCQGAAEGMHGYCTVSVGLQLDGLHSQAVC